LTPPLDKAAAPEPTSEATVAQKTAQRRLKKSLLDITLIAGGVTLLVLAIIVGGLRYSMQSESGRAVALSLLNGLPIGGVGRLHVEGLDGDLLGDFRLQKLEIIDAKGPWLEASDLAMRWAPEALLLRSFHTSRITVSLIRILRQPIMTPQPTAKPVGELPIAVRVDSLQIAVETLPAFSMQRGLWDISGRVALTRKGAAEGEVAARSRLHIGDGLTADFKMGEGRDVRLRADAVEATGGALAGALGLQVNRRLAVHARVDGTVDAGSLTLSALSGQDSVIDARGLWGRKGATINGRVNFMASRLTGFLAAGAGPEAQINLQTQHISGDLYDIAGFVKARDASASGHGPVDWRARHTTGLAVQVQVADMSRWLPIPKIGLALVQGNLSGDLSQLQVKGVFKGRQIVQNGYALGEASGPATLIWTPKTWRLEADLAGANGGGAGLLPALLGARPRVGMDLTILPTGHYLFHRLTIAGAGLKLDASGGQGLFGDLSFKGSAAISNLAAAHTGAKGLIDATWSARLGKGATIWNVDADAVAKDFATGFADVDHLLGPGPTLKAKGEYGSGALHIEAADLVGKALKTRFKGTLGDHGELDFDGNWEGAGPFEVGSVEIAGAASGAGMLGGSLSAPTAKLTADIASIDLGPVRIKPAKVRVDLAKGPDGLSGQMDISGASRYGSASLASDFRLAGSDLALSHINVDVGGVKAAGAIALHDDLLTSADLALEAHSGAFLATGVLAGVLKLTPGADGGAARLDIEGKDMALPGVTGVLHTLTLHGVGPWAHLPLKVSLDSIDPIAWRFSGDGRLDQQDKIQTLELSGQGRLRKLDFKTVGPATLKLDGGTRDLHLVLNLGGGQAALSTHQTPDRTDGKALLTGVALSALDPDLVGAISGELDLTGRGPKLDGALDLALVGARSRDAPASLALDGHVRADLSGDRLKLTAAATNPQGLKSSLSMDLPADAAAQPLHVNINRTRPITGAFSADGELRPLWDLFIGGGQTLSGRVVTKGTLAGSINAPHAVGEASLTGGKFVDIATGLTLQNLAIKANFGSEAVAVSQASAVDGHGGTLSGVGDISLLREGGSTFTLKLSKFRLFDNDLGRASASGAVTVNRAADGHAKLTGALRVDRADIVANTPTPTGVIDMPVVEIHRPIKEGEDAPSARATPEPPVALDVAIRAPRGIFVKGKGLNVELSLDSHVGGTVIAPTLTGTANLVLGSYDFAGKRFDFDQRGVIHLGTTPETIRLDLSATLTEPTLTAVVRVGGTAAKPDITLSSTPVLPQDEVLSQVLFGSSAAQLGPAQAAELASALASLAGGGGFDVLGRLRTFAGLDRLALGAGVTGTGVAGGKYINDNVYLELIGGGREGPAASVEWRVRKNFSVISQVGAQGDAQLSIQFRKNY
jgi:translocation and assembly module TamB